MPQIENATWSEPKTPRISKLTSMIVQYDGMIDLETIDMWRNALHKVFDGKVPRDGKAHNRNNHGFRIENYLHEPLALQLNHQVKDAGFKMLSRYARDCPIISYSMWYELGVAAAYYYRTYDKGDDYQWHVDKAKDPTTDLKVSILIYLNDDFEGGNTMFLNERLRVEPKKGRILMFPCGPHFIHKSSEILSGKKDVIWNCFSQNRLELRPPAGINKSRENDH
tara:strand:+ start:225 stop:893 length:669 start_codon:yes stop_codon:yes gene_type:complete